MGVYISDQTKKGWLTSILELGAWVGTLYSGFLAEIFSRKYAILVNTAIFIVGVVIQTTAVTAAGSSSILAGRFITGKHRYCLKSAAVVLTFDRHGCWCPLHDRPDVQRRGRSTPITKGMWGHTLIRLLYSVLRPK